MGIYNNITFHPKNKCDTFNIMRYKIKKDGEEYIYFVDQNKDDSIHTELFSMDGKSVEDAELIKYARDLVSIPLDTSSKSI